MPLMGELMNSGSFRRRPQMIASQNESVYLLPSAADCCSMDTTFVRLIVTHFPWIVRQECVHFLAILRDYLQCGFLVIWYKIDQNLTSFPGYTLGFIPGDTISR